MRKYLHSPLLKKLRIGLLASVLMGVIAGAWSFDIPPPTTPLHIVDLSVTGLKDREVSVAFVVANWSHHSQSGEAWWFLAPKGTNQPWIARKGIYVYLSPKIDFKLSGRKSIIINWDVMVPRAGAFQLSGWVHYRNRLGEFVHSDGVFYQTVVKVG